VASQASLEPSVASKISVGKMLIDILLLPRWLSRFRVSLSLAQELCDRLVVELRFGEE